MRDIVTIVWWPNMAQKTVKNNIKFIHHNPETACYNGFLWYLNISNYIERPLSSHKNKNNIPKALTFTPTSTPAPTFILPKPSPTPPEK